MIVKAINYLQKDVVNEEDFFFSGEVFIGPENQDYDYEVYDFNIISTRRLYNDLKEEGVMLNKGWLISKTFNEFAIEQKINSIVKKCESTDDERTYQSIDSYLRRQEN